MMETDSVIYVDPVQMPTASMTSAVTMKPTPTLATNPNHYTREEQLKIMEYHQHMASYYKQLKLTAEHTPEMGGSVCHQELQRKRGSIHDRSWDELPLKRGWEDGTEGIVIPDDAEEKLSAIPGVWDLAIEMGFLKVCKADD